MSYPEVETSKDMLYVWWQSLLKENKKDMNEDQRKLMSSILTSYYLIHLLKQDDLLLQDLKENLPEFKDLEKIGEITLELTNLALKK